MKFDEWVEFGIENGFASYIFDWVESGPELSDNELANLEDGDSIEIPCLRLYRNIQ